MRFWWRTRSVPAWSLSARLSIVRVFDFLGVTVEVGIAHRLFTCGWRWVDGRPDERAMPEVRATTEAP